MNAGEGVGIGDATRVAHQPTAFAEVSGRRRGYERQAVDAFLVQARAAFEQDEEGQLRSAQVRTIAFPLVRGGYEIAAVDAALSRIEDTFALREREEAMSRRGARAWVAGSRESAQVVLDRLLRPRRRRFDRVGVLSFGYRIDEVDQIADAVVRYLQSGEPLSTEQVRDVAFRMQRGGYRERQVDALLDDVVDVILAIG